MAGPQQARKSGSGSGSGRDAARRASQPGTPGQGAAQRGRANRAAGGQRRPGQSGSPQVGSRQASSRPGGTDRGSAGQGSRSQAGAAVTAARPGEQIPPPATGWRRLTGSFGPAGTLKLATFVLAVLGLAVSAYLTYTHFAGIGPAGCSAKSDACVQVQFSPQAEVFGVFPVAVLGLAFFLFMVPMTSPWAWRLKQPAVYWTRLGAVIIGMIFVLYLVYVEIIQIGAICPYCTSVHIMTFLLFGLLIYDAAFRGPGTAATTRR